MSSISVPIEKYRSYHDSYHDSPRHYGGPGGSGPGDNGPPYIVKLMNLPVTSDDSFVVDLFESRYTPFVKFKIVVDPVSSPLETHVIKKVAFVELTNYQDMTKVLKWMDLYYKGSRRVVIEPADFGDFQNCISFNQQHEQELMQVLDDFVAGRVHERHINHYQDRSSGRRLSGMPLPDQADSHGPRNDFLRPRTQLLHEPPLAPVSAPAPPPQPVSAPPKPKANPFGNAKPVDILAKEKEHESHIITINNTTVRTVGSEDHEASKQSRRFSQSKQRRPSFNLLKRSSSNEPRVPSSVPVPVPAASAPAQAPAPAAPSPPVPTLSPAAVPPSSWGNKASGMSLADILASQENDSLSTIRKKVSAKKSPKPIIVKPVILKKKNPTTTQGPDLVTEKQPETVEDKEQDAKAQELEIENKLNKKKKSLSKAEDQKVVNGDKSDGIDVVTEPEQVKTTVPKPHRSPVRPKVDLLSSAKTHLPGDRPNFKQHFDEMTKKAATNKEYKSTKLTNGSSRPSSGHRRNIDSGDSSTTTSELNGDIKFPAREIGRYTHNLSKVFRRKPEEREKEKMKEVKVKEDKGDESKPKEEKGDESKEKEEEREDLKTKEVKEQKVRESKTVKAKPEKVDKSEKRTKPKAEKYKAEKRERTRAFKSEKSRTPEVLKSNSATKDETKVISESVTPQKSVTPDKPAASDKPVTSDKQAVSDKPATSDEPVTSDKAATTDEKPAVPDSGNESEASKGNFRGRGKGNSRGRGFRGRGRGRGRGAARGISSSNFTYIRNKNEEGQ